MTVYVVAGSNEVKLRLTAPGDFVKVDIPAIFISITEFNISCFWSARQYKLPAEDSWAVTCSDCCNWELTVKFDIIWGYNILNA